MMRSILALTAGGICALMGLRRSRESTLRRLRLNRWTSLMEHIALLLNEEAGSLPEILRTAAGESTPADRLLLDLADCITLSPLSPADSIFAAHPLPPDEDAELRRCFARLCIGSRDTRVQAARECAAAFAHLSASTREKSDADAKMWRQLGLLGGACLTLWLM